MADSTEYTDDTPIGEYAQPTADNVKTLAAQDATDIRHKMYGHDVREALARWVEIGLSLWTAMDADLDAQKTAATLKQADQDRHISNVESSQAEVLQQFQQVIAGATKDSEVILARSSDDYGNFATLDARLENIESMMAKQVPAGYTVTIKHGLGRNPDVSVYYYEDAIGVETDGLGTAKVFGGTSPVALTASVTYTDSNTVTISLPAAYALSGTVIYQEGDRCWYLIDGNRVLKFDLGVSATENPSNAGGSSTGGTTVGPTTTTTTTKKPVTTTTTTTTPKPTTTTTTTTATPADTPAAPTSVTVASVGSTSADVTWRD